MDMDLLKIQRDRAKSDMVGKLYRNVFNGKSYYVKGIVIDSDSLELRVVYSDGITIDDWDTTLVLFIQKFKIHKPEENINE